MDIVTVDFETFYDKDYSLSKITTEAYVRDPRFEVIGVGVKVNDNPTDWYTGEHPGKFLKSLDYTNRAILCHNTVFDGAILSWHFGIRPRLWLDTLSMARPWHGLTVGGSLKKLVAHYRLGEKGDEVIRAMGMRRKEFTREEMDAYGRYCTNDVDLTYKLFNKLKGRFNVSELMLIDQTIRMYTEPLITIDKALLEQHLIDVRCKKTDLLDELSFLGDTNDIIKTNLMSNAKLASVLEGLGVDVPMKTSPATGKATFAFGKTDKAFTDLLDHPDERVSAVVAARLGVKSTLEETRTASLIGVAERGPLPIMLNYYGAHTGRFSGGDKMNLQNLPRGGTLRRALCAPEGKVLVASDSSQIEARIVAWVAGQEHLLQSFREGRDVYSEFATDVYGRKITKADKLERHVGKTAVLGLGYGMGAPKFRATLALGAGGIKVEMDESEAKRIVQAYRSKYPMIPQLWNRCGWALTQMAMGKTGEIKPYLPFEPEHIGLPNGLQINYPLLQTADGGFKYCGDARAFFEAAKARVLGAPIQTIKWQYIYGGKVVENIVQALARIVVAEQMVTIGQRYKTVLQVHDEIVIMVDEHEAEEALEFVQQVMKTPPAWAPDLPVNCEAHVGINYGEVK
jgi:DNA polymerase I-like protein with 3'-5' exonuclease and polymerase domains